MADGCFAYVIGFAAALGHHCIRRAGQHDAGFDSLGFEDLGYFVREQIVGGDVYLQRRCPLSVADRAIGRRGEDRSRIYQDVNAAKSRDGRIERGLNCAAIANIDSRGDSVLAANDCLGFGRNLFRGAEFAVCDHHMRSAFRGQEGYFAANPAGSADHQHHAAAQFFRSRLPAYLGFFQCPVLDAEGFRSGQCNVVFMHLEGARISRRSGLRQHRGTPTFIEMPGALHHVDGVDIKLTRDARLRLVFAEAEHADTGHQHDSWVRVPHCRRIFQGMLLVVVGIFAAIFLHRCFRRSLNVRWIRRVIPLHQQRTNLGADEMIRTTGAEIGELRSRMRIDEIQYFRDISEAADHALLGGDAPAQKGHQLVGNLLPFLVRSIPGSPKR